MWPHRADPAQTVPTGSAFLQLIIRSAAGSASTWIKAQDDFPRRAGRFEADGFPIAQIEAELATGTVERDDPVGVLWQAVADKGFVRADAGAGVAGDAKRGIDDGAVIGEPFRCGDFRFALRGDQGRKQAPASPVDLVSIGARLRQRGTIGLILAMNDQPHGRHPSALSDRDVQCMRMFKRLEARVARTGCAIAGEDMEFANTFFCKGIEVAMAECVPAGKGAAVGVGRFAAGGPGGATHSPRKKDRQRALKGDRIAGAGRNAEAAAIAGGGIEREPVVIENNCLSGAGGNAGLATRKGGQRMHAHAGVDARKGARGIHRHQLGAAPGRKREASS